MRYKNTKVYKYTYLCLFTYLLVHMYVCPFFSFGIIRNVANPRALSLFVGV